MDATEEPPEVLDFLRVRDRQGLGLLPQSLDDLIEADQVSDPAPTPHLEPGDGFLHDIDAAVERVVAAHEELTAIGHDAVRRLEGKGVGVHLPYAGLDGLPRAFGLDRDDRLPFVICDEIGLLDLPLSTERDRDGLVPMQTVLGVLQYLTEQRTEQLGFYVALGSKSQGHGLYFPPDLRSRCPVDEPLPLGPLDSQKGALTVVGKARVPAKLELPKVAGKVVPADGVVSPVDASLQKAESGLDRVGVNHGIALADVFSLAVLDGLMPAEVIPPHGAIHTEVVGDEPGGDVQVLVNDSAEILGRDPLDDLHTKPPSALDHREDGRLLGTAPPLAGALVPGLPADVCLVGFDGPTSRSHLSPGTLAGANPSWRTGCDSGGTGPTCS